ncbi:hypothetical protein BDR26DRAFT_860525 [Obelidium mucronatum]|nr:hypothetical protein BDR26DRAFT_860525 [Obelidium mucronatum]
MRSQLSAVFQRLNYRGFSSTKSVLKTNEGPLLTLYTRKYCGLCEDARDNILSLRHEFKFQFETEDIDSPTNKQWKEQYNYEVPVLHINEKPAFMNAVPIEALSEILKVLAQ